MADTSIPSHVPEHLVRDVTLETLEGGDRDALRALCALHGGPDILWAPQARMNVGGGWIATRHALIRDVLQDGETFSSKATSGFSKLLGETWDLIPLEKDGDEHRKYRALMNPIFSPKRIQAIDDGVRITAERLLDDILAAGECEFVDAFARPFPVIVFLELFGFPTGEMQRFLAWEDGLLHGKTMEARVTAAREIKDYMVDAIAARRADPRDDLISFAATSEIEGRQLSGEEVLGICYLLFVAGLDTVASSLGFHFRHLAEHPTHQQALREDPERIPDAIEELMRANPVVTTVRTVTRDTVFHGVAMRAGDRVVLPTGLAGRDEREFPGPHDIDFGREANRHITFGSGPHRCLGSHLARREIKLAYELWLSKVPPFRVKAGETVVTHTSGVAGVDYLPLVWD